MSSDSVIEEDILEQIDDDSAEGTEIAKETGDKTKVTENETSKNRENTSVGQFDENGYDDNSNTELEKRIDSKQETSKLNVDPGEKVSVAVINYSGLLAENVLQEALLINEIYAKDIINLNADENSDIDRDKDIRKHLFPSENGRILSKENGAGYDPYLLSKLLGSQADPEEVAEVNGFDGNEEHFRSKEETYPGLDSEDAYVKEGLDRIISDREFSDKNNNQMTTGLTDQYDDNVLQTIHEDTELVIEDNFRTNNVEPIQEVTGANIEQLPGTNEGIDEAEETEKDDEKSRRDEEEPQEVDKKSQPDVEDKLIEINLNGYNELTEVLPNSDDETSIEEVPKEDDVSEASDDELDCCEMTFKQKQAMVRAVRKGDINLLETLLEKKNADMGMTWYGENLLMVAIRSERQAMAEFLIDNDIDWKYERKLVEVDEDGIMSVHKITARQMAYDLDMDDLVELLDYKMNNLFPFVRPKPRAPRLRQPITPFAPPPLDEAMHEDFLIDPDEAKKLQKQVTDQYKQRQKEIELENLEMMQRRRKGLTSEVESVHTAKSRHTCSDSNVIPDDISQVFGPDEGYETMSPVSPHRHDYHVPDMKEHVSFRGTRSYHLKKAFVASKTDHLKRMDSPDYPMYQNNLIESIGSYNFESRRWHHPMSAPQFRNYSVESLQNQSVHTGLPFVHGGTGKPVSASSEKKNIKQRRSQSAHSNISPYSQVAKLLEQSRLFSPIITSRSSTPYFPAISNKKSTGSPQTKTRINYIYADRSSAKPKRSEFSSLKSDLLPKRKLKC